MPTPVKDAAAIFAWVIAAMLILLAVSFLIAQTGCAFGFAKPDFCTPDATVARRQFFLETLAALGALYGALTIIKRS